MLAKTFAAASMGFDGQVVEVECDLGGGLPGVTIVGLPNKAVDEAKERVKSAVKNSKLDMPRKRTILNLAPADLPKDGTAYDVPMAIAILAASEQVDGRQLQDSMFIGELSLDGALRPVPGVLNYVQTAKENGFTSIYIPHKNRDEARLIKGIDIFPIKTLKDLYRHLVDEKRLTVIDPYQKIPARKSSAADIDLADIHGQEYAKRALEIAATGGHNLLMNGPPGAGKTMLARGLISILAPLSREEIVATTKLHSLTGQNKHSIITSRPFRTPHHTTSDIAIIGGGQHATPGEISLAHNGILFLDELPEFKRSVLEVLRQPLEDGTVTVARAKRSITYPAEFMLVATQNPCPCGWLDDELRECSCSAAQVARYQKKVSGPLLDRIDMRITVKRLEHYKLMKKAQGEKSRDVARRVALSRKHAHKRGQNIMNARLNNHAIKKYCRLDETSSAILERAMQEFDLSARGYMRTLKVARTIADLDAEEEIAPHHISEALQYRLN